MGANPNPRLSPKPDPKPKLGLRAWMERVLLECDRAAAGFDADAVHDLRVALRRCRSLADGLMAIDPDSSWKDMKRAGKKLFQALGELRDMQVMAEWIEKLGDTGAGDAASRVSTENRVDPVALRLLDHVRAREAVCKQHAFKDLDQFDRKQWRQWSRALPRRAARVRPGSVVYLHLALEKWTAAYDLHKHALRTRSRVGLHQLRIGIKRFRYTVENFLPRQHALWGSDLKELQDLLGDVHDLDVLWATAVEIGAFPDLESSDRWREKLNAERGVRIARYRDLMVGRQSLWRVWRAQLPAGPALRAAALARLRVWAGYLDPDFLHSQRVEKLALLLYDGLRAARLVSAEAGTPNVDDWREVLQAAALMHDVGKAKGAEKHQKRSYRMIRGLARPLGWSARELELAAVVARYHRGALPRPRGRALQMLELPERRVALELAGVLRLANALDSRNGHEPQLEVRVQDELVLVRAAGYSALERSGEEVAAARHLLETVLRRPVLVRVLRVPAALRPAGQPRATVPARS
jgi:CHAD domain-containing protein